MIDNARKGLAGVILMEKSSLDFHPKIYISSKFSLVWAGKYFSVEKIIIFLDFIMPHFFLLVRHLRLSQKKLMTQLKDGLTLLLS